MAAWWKAWGNRATRAVAQRPPAEPLRAVSAPEDLGAMASAWRSFIPLPNGTPFEMLRVYRFLRDAIPDVSDAVWTWKRLCQSGYDIEIAGESSGVAKRRAERLIDALNRRVNSGDNGMDGLLDVVYGSLFTYGAAALEIVPSQSRESIHDVVPIDVWTVRFRRGDDGALQPYQVVDGQEVALPRERFIYLGLDRDGTNPYGRSMLRSIPFVVKIQQRLLDDMAKAVHNAGWAKLHVSYTPEERQRGESAEAYEQRIASNFESLRDKLGGLETDQNLVTYDNVRVDLVRGDQRSQVFYENHKVIEEQVITGVHLMPILMGRNYGTTETYGTAQFEIINRQARAVNRSIKRLLERLYNFELALMWGEAEARVHMRENRTVDVLKEASARAREIANALKLRDAGLMDADGVARELGLKRGATD